MLFKTVKFVVICFVSKRKLIHNPSKKSSIFLPNSFTVSSDIGIIILIQIKDHPWLLISSGERM